ncbi:HAD-IA family hydrolase [Streptomyces sp. NPDC021356]|uniref:HAD-IA family hydrolase n=1 Tax=Streptomyces sp. NPDC021356 TaxID=3154900 RepID=UPI0033F6B9F1
MSRTCGGRLARSGYDLDRNYDAVVISERHGLRKPQPEIFALVLKMLDLPAEECVFVDDTEEYLAPAAELGFATIHARQPHETIARMEALLGVSLGGTD